MQAYITMESEKESEEYGLEPVSPTAHYMNSSLLSVCVLAVLESEVPVDDSLNVTLVNDVFLPINPRFSSIMVTDKRGSKKWKRVEVKLENHVKVPTFPAGLSPTSYDDYFSEYLSNIGTEQLPQTQPLWEIHIIKYPTSDAAGSVVFKLHHSLGDGYSLVGALLSCLQRADDSSLSLSFPLRKSQPQPNNIFMSTLPRVFSSVLSTVSDFGGSLLKGSSTEDDITPIRSGNPMVQYLPITITTITFSLDQIKQVKANLGVTINDVVTGVVFLGTRLYMKSKDDASTRSKSTALVMLNTRMVDGYKSIKEMVKPGTKPLWGNHIAFLHVSVPELRDEESTNPLEFVWKAQQIIKMKRSSLGAPLVAILLELMRKFRGPEVAAKYVHSTLKNTSMAVSNLIGPVEKMALSNHTVKGLYFMMVGGPQSLTVTMMSYMGKLRVAVGSEKGFIDGAKYKKCLECAFEMILKAASEPPPSHEC